jgi:hypothetical protein
MRKRIYLYTMLISGLQILFLFACSDDPELEIEIPKETLNLSNTDRPKTIKEQLLLELNLCSDTNSVPLDLSCLKDTLFLPINKDIDLSEGFVLMAKYDLESQRVLKTCVYQRDQDDSLIEINEFSGVLVNIREASSGYNDILLRFIEIEESKKFFYNCWFSYSIEDLSYRYMECFSINQEAKTGYQFDVYSSTSADKEYKRETDKEVKDILLGLGYIN